MTSPHVGVRLATSSDVGALAPHEHLDPTQLADVVAERRILVAVDPAGEVAGWLRWGLLWDQVPFANLLYVLAPHRGSGVGRALVEHWERRHRVGGQTLVLTSTVSAETAQNFWRHLAYVDAGCLLLPGEPAELLFTKTLS